MSTAITERHENDGALATAYGAFSPDVLCEQIQLIQQCMAQAMKSGHHYGTIPNCGDKPTLLKPGAEKLCFLFRLVARPSVEVIELGHGHKEYRILCKLYSLHSGDIVGEGVGCCSTMESKYRWRNAMRKCPVCGKEAIVKRKAEKGGGYMCIGNDKGGCWAKFNDGDPAIEGQVTGRVENVDLADCYNTVLKMAKKRALIDATLTATAASDIFAQDLEDLVDDNGHDRPAPPRRQPPPSRDPERAGAMEEASASLLAKFSEDLAAAESKADVDDVSREIGHERAHMLPAHLEQLRKVRADSIERINREASIGDANEDGAGSDDPNT